MFENFSRNPKVEILTTELCAGVVASDLETKDEIRDYLESRKDVENVREIINLSLYYNEEESLFTYIVKDPSKMRNSSICYKGRLPEYDNEVVISGSFAKKYGYDIGDEIKALGERAEDMSFIHLKRHVEIASGDSLGE